VPFQGSGGSERLLGPVVCCSSFDAATSKADNWLALMPHLLKSQVGCFVNFPARATTTAVLEESQTMLRRSCFQMSIAVPVFIISTTKISTYQFAFIAQLQDRTLVILARAPSHL
jgi:hypothetical protein